MVQGELPSAQDGQHLGFEMPCKSIVCAGAQRAYVFQQAVTKEGALYHRYLCPEQKCRNAIDIQQSRRRAR